jgi:MscS family membrane protein
VFILADRPYKVGDYIVLDSGERGRVSHIGLRSTRLLTRDDVEVTIPNRIMGQAKIVNETGGVHEKMRVRVPVGVAYGSEIATVRAALLAAAAASPLVQAEPAPRVRFRSFGESSLDFELLVWVEQPDLRGLCVDDLLERIYLEFGKAGVTIPFPQRELWMRPAPDAAPR